MVAKLSGRACHLAVPKVGAGDTAIAHVIVASRCFAGQYVRSGTTVGRLGICFRDRL